MEPLTTDSSLSPLTADNQRIWESNAQHFVDARVQRILDRLPRRQSGGRFLDIGCLDGTLTRLYAERVGADSVHGIDMASAPAAREKGIQVEEFDLNARAPLPYPDAFFDVIVCIETLEHVYPTDHLVAEIHRILKPGGTAIIDVPRLDSFLNIGLLALGFQPPGVECTRDARYGSINRDSVLTGHVAYFTRRGLLALLRAKGFRIEHASQVGQRSGWLMEQAARGRRVPLWVRALWWVYDAVSLKKEYLVVEVQREA